MPKHPGSAFNWAASDAIAAHGMNGDHSEQSAPRRSVRQNDFAELVTCDTFDAIVRREQPVDDDVVTLWAVCLVGVEISILVKGMSKLGRGGG